MTTREERGQIYNAIRYWSLSDNHKWFEEGITTYETLKYAIDHFHMGDDLISFWNIVKNGNARSLFLNSMMKIDGEFVLGLDISEQERILLMANVLGTKD